MSTTGQDLGESLRRISAFSVNEEILEELEAIVQFSRDEFDELQRRAGSRFRWLGRLTGLSAHKGPSIEEVRQFMSEIDMTTQAPYSEQRFQDGSEDMSATVAFLTDEECLQSFFIHFASCIGESDRWDVIASYARRPYGYGVGQALALRRCGVDHWQLYVTHSKSTIDT